MIMVLEEKTETSSSVRFAVHDRVQHLTTGNAQKSCVDFAAEWSRLLVFEFEFEFEFEFGVVDGAYASRGGRRTAGQTG